MRWNTAFYKVSSEKPTGDIVAGLILGNLSGTCKANRAETAVKTIMEAIQK
jgi:hypothetical protein